MDKTLIFSTLGVIPLVISFVKSFNLFGETIDNKALNDASNNAIIIIIL